MTMRVAYQGRERLCPICGRTYILYEDWAYKKHKGTSEMLFCSWKCLRKYENEELTPFERRENIKQAIRDGLTNAEISKLFGEYSRKIDYWRKKLKEEDEKNERKTGREGGGEAD